MAEIKIIVISIIVSAVATKIITAKHLKVIDSYLDETVENVKKMVKEVISKQKWILYQEELIA